MEFPDKLRDMGYTENDLEKSNPYNKWMQTEELTCPKCGSNDVIHCHHDGDFVAPECDYLRCADCDYTWGME